jgi:hypothetical protein
MVLIDLWSWTNIFWIKQFCFNIRVLKKLWNLLNQHQNFLQVECLLFKTKWKISAKISILWHFNNFFAFTLSFDQSDDLLSYILQFLDNHSDDLLTVYKCLTIIFYLLSEKHDCFYQLFKYLHQKFKPSYFFHLIHHFFKEFKN